MWVIKHIHNYKYGQSLCVAATNVCVTSELPLKDYFVYVVQPYAATGKCTWPILKTLLGMNYLHFKI